MNDLKPILLKLASGSSLKEKEAQLAFDIVMSGGATPSQIGALCMGMRVRGETVDEIAGAAKSMREKALKMEAPEGSVDTAGTGGDGMGTYNVSTAAAIVAAACGVPVAKHGNKAISSKTGSADVLSALGVNIDAPMELIRESLWSHNIGFFMAPRHHGAMKYVGPVRKKIGKRTIFNMIGPLSSPALVKNQVVGVFDEKLLEIFANALKDLKIDFAWIVNSEDGLDEISPYAKTNVVQLKNNNITQIVINPKELNIKPNSFENLLGKNPEYNSQKILEIFKGEDNDFSLAVCLNAAAGLIVCNKHENFEDAYEECRKHILSGKTFNYLKLIQNG